MRRQKKKDTVGGKKKANDFSACASSVQIKLVESHSSLSFVMSQFLVNLQRSSPPVNRWSTGAFLSLKKWYFFLNILFKPHWKWQKSIIHKIRRPIDAWLILITILLFFMTISLITWNCHSLLYKQYKGHKNGGGEYSLWT